MEKEAFFFCFVFIYLFFFKYSLVHNNIESFYSSDGVKMYLFIQSIKL